MTKVYWMLAKAKSKPTALLKDVRNGKAVYTYLEANAAKYNSKEQAKFVADYVALQFLVTDNLVPLACTVEENNAEKTF